MHNNYFFLRKLSASLAQKIKGWEIGSCFSQDKNELIIGFYSDADELYLRAHQDPQFSCLSFLNSYSRARKNSIDLFPSMIGRRVTGVHQYHFERAFNLMLDNEFLLLFKLFGNFSNVMLFREGNCIDVFRHSLNDDQKIDPPTLDRDITINETGFMESGNDPGKYIPAFDDRMMIHLKDQGFDSLNEHQQWLLFKKFLAELNNPRYYIVSVDEKVRFSLFPQEKVLGEYADPLKAVTEFYVTHQKHFWLTQEKSKLLRILRGQLKKQEQYIRKGKQKLEEWENHPDYRQMADILMANLHVLKTGMEEAELFDFYNNRMIRIRLNPGLSPQKTAERFYRKSKNSKKEFEILEKNMHVKQESITRLNRLIREVNEAEDLKTVRSLNEKYGTAAGGRGKPEGPTFRSYEFMGFRILVGRNSKNNETLTFEYGYKDDLWLHAKDVPGSHVLVKFQAGKNFPKPVIERAGQLAAYYSGNRNINVCPVIFTSKKYVRKIKGAPPGTVHVDKEDILFVNPSDHS